MSRAKELLDKTRPVKEALSSDFVSASVKIGRSFDNLEAEVEQLLDNLKRNVGDAGDPKVVAQAKKEAEDLFKSIGKMSKSVMNLKKIIRSS